MRPEAIKQALAKQFGSRINEFRCNISGPRFASDNAVIYWGECAQFSTPVAIKCVRDVASLDEYDALVKAEERLGSACEFAVPRPILKLEKEKIIVMEWIEAKTLSKLLTQSYLPLAKTQSYVNRAGRWLHRFHNIETLPCSRLPARERISYLREVMAEGQLNNDSFAQEALQVLEEAMPFAIEPMLPQGVIHGDFKPDNVLLSDDRTVGLDFAMRYRNVVVSDVANFIVHLVLLGYEPAAFVSGLFRRRHLLMASFLEGYQAEGKVIPNVPIAWMTLHTLLRAYVAQHRRGSSPRVWYLIRCIRHEILRSVQDLTERVNKRSRA